MAIGTSLLLTTGGTPLVWCSSPSVSERASVTPAPPVAVLPSLMVSPGKTAAYPGEEIPVTVTVGYPPELTVRDIRYPRILHPGLTLRETGSPLPGTEEGSNTTWTTLKFTYLLSGNRPGEFILGPTTLDCSLLLPATGASGFFDAPLPEPRQLNTQGVSITILPFPLAGRPDGFSGAVGDYRLTVSVQPRQVTVGEPVTVTSTISGFGAIETVTCPSVTTDQRFRAYPPRTRRLEGSVVCEQLLIPDDGLIRIIPPVSFTFFDSVQGSYRTVRQGPFPLKVTVAPSPSFPLISSPTAVHDHTGADRSKDLHTAVRMVSCIALLTLAILLLWRFLRRTAPSSTNETSGTFIPEKPLPETYLREVEAGLAEYDSGQFHTAVFRALQQYLGRHCHIAPQGITTAIIETHLRPEGCSAPVMNMVETLFRDCDRVRYGDARINREEAEAIIKRLRQLKSSLEAIKNLNNFIHRDNLHPPKE